MSAATDDGCRSGAGRALSIRRAGAEDLEEVWPLARDFATSFTPVHDAFASTFGQLLDEPRALLLVAAHHDEVVGYLLAHAHATFLANGPVAWVEEVMVAARLRGHGVGRALMASAEDRVVAEGCAYVSLASRRAEEFYPAIGYERSAAFFRKDTP